MFKSDSNLKIGDQIQQGMSCPTAGQQKRTKKECTLEVINKWRMTQSLPNLVRTCINMWAPIPDMILGILWNGVKWHRMTPQGNITWNYWKTTDASKKHVRTKKIHIVHYSSFLTRDHSSKTDKWLKSNSNLKINIWG